MPYTPGSPGAVTDFSSLVSWVMEELGRIALELSETTALELRPIFKEPDNPREGMIVFADGTSWNPGGGKGVYTYLSGAWSKL